MASEPGPPFFSATAGAGCSSFGASARTASVSELKRRARSLGVEIPSNVEKSELIALLDAAERRRGSGSAPCGSAPCGPTHSGSFSVGSSMDSAMRASAHGVSGQGGRSVAELKARLGELGIEVPRYIVEKHDLLAFVTEAERHVHRKRAPRARQAGSPQPKVRFRNHAGQLPPPWYQKESRSRPGNFYFVNADTGETRWDLPQGASSSLPRRERPQPSGHTSSPTGAAVGSMVPPPTPFGGDSAARMMAAASEEEGADAPLAPRGEGGVPDLAASAAAARAAVPAFREAPCSRGDTSARHDYRDDGFGDDSDPSIPEVDRRWSRQGVMTARRDEESEKIKELDLAQALPPEAAGWDPDTTISPLAAGTVQGSHLTWVRGKMIGRGSLGRVFKALDQKTGQILAVKEVTVDLRNEADQQFIEDLKNEVSIMQELQHPNIVRYLGHDFMDNCIYMYLEHMPGGSVTQALQQFGAFDEALLAEYSKQILSGLEYLHTRTPAVVHRDIKGPNILVGADCRVKLADFGCAKRTQETMTHTMRGSMHWMAPEVISHERYGRAADIWSFGCVAIEMGTAKVPWGKLDNPMAAVIKIGMSEETPPLPEGLSPPGEEFIALCVQRDPNLRPTAADLLGHAFVRDIVLPE